VLGVMKSLNLYLLLNKIVVILELTDISKLIEYEKDAEIDDA